MTNLVQCNHEPESLEDINLSRGECFFVRCKHCGFDLMIRLKGDFTKIRETYNTEDLKLKFNRSEEDLAILKKYSKYLSIPQPLPDFKITCGYDSDKRLEILYEMVADGEIDFDQFNKFSSRS